MSKFYLICVFCFISLSQLVFGNARNAPLWTVNKGLSAPESVYLDESTGFIYVSNVAGVPNELDGNGWISKVSKEGKVVSEKWADGFNAPKGMRSFQGTLWVSDVHQVHSVDLKTGKILKSIPLEGAIFLNDVAIDGDGRVYISDTMADKIFIVEGEKSKVFAEGKELEAPNGLLVDGDDLLIATWGPGIKPDWSTESMGRLLAIDLKTKKTKVLTKKRFGHLDGLEKEGKGVYLVSDWVDGLVYRVSLGHSPELLLSGFKGAADIGYDKKDSILFVPRMGEDRVDAYRLQKKKKSGW